MLSSSLRQCLTEMCQIATVQVLDRKRNGDEVAAWLSCAESMLDSFSELSQHLPASIRSAVPLAGDMRALLCAALLCPVLLCCALLRHALPCPAVPCRAVLCYVVLCYVMLRANGNAHAMQCHTATA